MDPEGFDEAARALASLAEGRPWRCVVARRGGIIWDRWSGLDPAAPLPANSMVKSLIASVAGISMERGMLPDLDEFVIDHFPELAEATGARGLHHGKGRHFTECDRRVTLRMLLDHTGGLMDRERKPGSGFHYATVPKVVLLNLIGRLHGYYHPADIHLGGGTGALLSEWIGGPIGANWRWEYRLLGNQPESMNHLFGNLPLLWVTAEDMLRIGWLWANRGRWGDEQIIPERWHRECVRVGAQLGDCAPPEDHIFGYGFWTNSAGSLWPNLPRDLYMSAGAGGVRIVIFPRQEAVAAFAPAPERALPFVGELRREEIIAPIYRALAG